MKLSKRLQALALVVVMLLSLCLMAGCNKENDTTPSGFKVTFMVEGKQYGEVQTVQKGRRNTAGFCRGIGTGLRRGAARRHGQNHQRRHKQRYNSVSELHVKFLSVWFLLPEKFTGLL